MKRQRSQRTVGDRLVVVCVAALLLVHGTLLTYSARVHSPTWDEVGHLAAGISHWELGKFELYSVNPPLVRTAAAAMVVLASPPKMDWSFYRSDPSLRSEVSVGRQMIEDNGRDSYGHFFLARMALVPVGLLGGWLCFLWGRDLFGPVSGLISLALWSFSPTVLAYGSVITPDLSSAVALLGSSYVFWRWLKTPRLSWAAALCVSLAVAILTKSVWLMLPLPYFAIWLTVCLQRRRAMRNEPMSNGEGRVGIERSWDQTLRSSVQLVGACLLALVLVNGFYGFSGSFRMLGDYTFVSSAFSGNPPVERFISPDCPDCQDSSRFVVERGNRFASSALAVLPVPLPANFVQGVDVQVADFQRGAYDANWQSYLFGQWKQGGWWYYYMVGLFVKVPVAIWGLVAVGTVSAFFWRPQREQVIGIICLLIPAAAFFAIVCASTGLNRYVRYAIPVLPVLFVWAGQVGRWAETQLVESSLLRRLARAFATAMCVWLAAVSLWNAPHHLSYFNEFAGGGGGGHAILCDSNIDWGQDLGLLEQWLESHPEASSSLYLAYFGSFDPASVGIDFQLPPVPGAPRANNQAVASLLSISERRRLKPGWYVISKNYLVGHRMPIPNGRNHLQFQFVERDAFAEFRSLDPVDEIGKTMLVYHIEEETLPRISTVAIAGR